MKEFINQIFEIELKAKELGTDKLDRNIRKLKQLMEEEGYTYDVPLDKKYQLSDTTIEANFIEPQGQNLIKKVLKPAIFFKRESGLELIQKAIVVVG